VKRLLTPQEHALWRRSLRGVRPLKSSHAPLAPETAGVAKAERSGEAPTVSNRASSRRLPVKRGEARADPFCAGDPKLERRVRRGRAPIEARLDLHGFRQGPARAALLRFLTEARAKGRRCVLVVTGKGGRYASTPGSNGVLRTRLRGWLSEDAFRQHVARASQAHPRHGGEGAFYVFVKAPLSGRRS